MMSCLFLFAPRFFATAFFRIFLLLSEGLFHRFKKRLQFRMIDFSAGIRAVQLTFVYCVVNMLNERRLQNFIDETP